MIPTGKSNDAAVPVPSAEPALPDPARVVTTAPGEIFLIKLFQGAGFEDYVKLARSHFSRVVTRKPKASRDRSNEVYLLGFGKLVKA